MLREIEVEVGRGKTVAEAVKKIGVTEQTYSRWKKQYGGLRIDQAKRLKDLEKENSRLKRLLADAELDSGVLSNRHENSRAAINIVEHKRCQRPFN